jgi:DeoR family transcriptional regulator of aga operon
VRQADRLSAILESVSRNGSVSVTELAAGFGVSVATVRRDLELLDDQRLISRIHGGAIARGNLYELPLLYKAARRQDEKRRIGKAAASLVGTGQTLGLTGGTTTLEVARALTDRSQLTIVTNALNIASELAVRANLKLVVPGGVARPESYELVGPLAESSLAELNLDVVFVGADGVDAAAGLTTHHEVEAYTNRALIRRARRVVVVADSSKLGRVAFARICTASEVHELITDGEAAESHLAALRDAGVQITQV